MIVVAGGGAGGRGAGSSNAGGGGGAGGFREGKTPQCTYTASPLVCTSGSNNGVPVISTRLSNYSNRRWWYGSSFQLTFQLFLLLQMVTW